MLPAHFTLGGREKFLFLAANTRYQAPKFHATFYIAFPKWVFLHQYREEVEELQL